MQIEYALPRSKASSIYLYIYIYIIGIYVFPFFPTYFGLGVSDIIRLVNFEDNIGLL